MRSILSLGLATLLAIGAANTGQAAIGSEQARQANSENAAQAPGGTGKTGQAGQNDRNSGTGATVGPSSGNHDTSLGYAKGAGENSDVGKSR